MIFHDFFYALIHLHLICSLVIVPRLLKGASEEAGVEAQEGRQVLNVIVVAKYV